RHSTPPRVSVSGRWLVLGIGLLALARVVVAARTPVIDDEAYYWIWSRHLTLSYLDHPPLVAWLDALTTAPGRTEWLLPLPAMWAFWRAVQGSQRMWWLCGAALGLGVLSKYPMIVLLAAALGVLSWPPYRRWWRTPGPYTAGAVAAVLAAPILVWNAQHGWA